MTGQDLIWWFEDLFYDLTHPGEADIAMLAVKLYFLFVAFVIGKHLLSIIWRVLYTETLSPLLDPIFKVVLFPFRLPWIIGRWLKRKSDDRRFARDQQQRQQEQDRRIQLEAAAREETRIRMEQQQIAEQIRLQNARRID